MEITIRQAGLADRTIIAEFNVVLAEESEGSRLEPARVQAGVDAVLKDPAKGVYYVVVAGGAVIGQTMITYEWSDWRNGNLWWIQSVYVKPEFRGQGVFRRLFEHVRAFLREAGHDPHQVRDLRDRSAGARGRSRLRRRSERIVRL